ncbi:MAG: bifunctional riboflavin kinase/FAD synthetase [Chloroflexi bacterium]|nr:MAG: bifunctional riboflavin kinase/FAD synthetase [Chloroflexota bacterium]
MKSMSDAPAPVKAAFERVCGGAHVVTIGNFDGVHLGHRFLIDIVRGRAAAEGARSMVITFEPHPISVLRPDAPFDRLSTPELKLSLLEAAGVDDIVVIPFDHAFAALSPEAFLRLVVEEAHPVAIYVGEGFRFGRARAGDGSTIVEHGRVLGYDGQVITRLADEHGEVVSSSAIRQALREGAVERAARMLGRRYRLRGTVEHGVARGRELGYPTANLHLPRWACVPGDGIYAGYAHVKQRAQQPMQAMIYIGTRPTFDNGERLVEVNILDFDGDLYTLDLEVEFVAFVRGDMAFDSVEDLVAQIADDETKTRARLLAEASEDAR